MTADGHFVNFSLGDQDICRVKLGGALRIVQDSMLNRAELEVEGGKPSYIRWTMVPAHRFGVQKIELVDEATGVKEIRKLKP
jgi:hypothetical protein